MCPMGRKRPTEDGGKRRATMTRVAEELGVSAMTVSNAYNRPERLSAALRERIFETARRLGYPGPNPLGQSLRRGRVGALGVIYDNLLSYAFEDQAAVSFLRGVSAAAEEEGLGLTLVPGSPRGERDASAIGRTLVDGFVVYSVADGDPVLEAALERGLPAVTVDQPRVEGVSFVGIDDEAAARAAAEHLVELGHRRYGVVSFGLSPDWRVGIADEERQRSASYRVSRSRLEGFAAALAADGVSWSEVPVYECPSSSKALGRDAAEVVLSRVPRPTAVIAVRARRPLGGRLRRCARGGDRDPAPHHRPPGPRREGRLGWTPAGRAAPREGDGGHVSPAHRARGARLDRSATENPVGGDFIAARAWPEQKESRTGPRET